MNINESNQRFAALQKEIKDRKLTATHRTRLERITALYTHVARLTAQRDAADDYWPRNERTAISVRLDQFKTPAFFLTAMESLVAEIQALN